MPNALEEKVFLEHGDQIVIGTIVYTVACNVYADDAEDTTVFFHLRGDRTAQRSCELALLREQGCLR